MESRFDWNDESGNAFPLYLVRAKQVVIRQRSKATIIVVDRTESLSHYNLRGFFFVAGLLEAEIAK